ncbi:MAG: hypothetical protein A2189_09240 [Paenibacillus sp. RIFOXYA1_FULL_44_5]|nr:MAG: hypothetical protein A2189_09240 [Paenibacillus sp. RIFOXYA1_FULL_44_5]
MKPKPELPQSTPAADPDAVNGAAPEPTATMKSSDTRSDKPETSSNHPSCSLDRSKLALFGVTINQMKADVLEKLGLPQGNFIMQDENPITVYQYPGFIIGFSQTNKLVFITVQTPEANPGLHDLKLGQTAQDAIKALGTPDTNTGFVYVYKGTNAILKLDIDPDTETIQSIKLFSAQ